MPKSVLHRICVITALMLLSANVAWSGSYSVLHGFQRNSGPESSGLIVDAAGNAYGTTAKGGFNDAGTVYQLSPTTGYHIIYAFSGHPDGRHPQGNLAFDAEGNLYGTAPNGGTFTECDSGRGCGMVFKLTPPANAGPWTETVLYNFTGGDDGANPQGGVIFDAKGNLYGTAKNGGASNSGVVFELTPGANNTWSESVLHTFGGGDGGLPQGSLTFDAADNLYGTSGAVVFELTSAGGGWSFNAIHRFDPSSGDGTGAEAGVIFDAQGNLYGTSPFGGEFDRGTVFQLTPNVGGWTESILHSFGVGSDGATPLASVVIDAAGNLYGTTEFGGGARFDAGTVFKLTPVGGGQWTESLFRFRPDQGYRPTTPLLLDGAGRIYGTARVVFRITP